MSEPEITPPFPSYKGPDPYVFISYSHRDSADVYAEIAWLHSQDVNVWYDEGIHAGDHWNEGLARAIRQSAVFLFFISPRSVVSNHCLRELNFAMSTDRPILSVHLETTELPDGVQFSIGDRQAILRSRYAQERYQHKLVNALTLQLTGDSEADISSSHRVAANNLPATDEPLVGRDEDLRQVCEQIQARRMTTLVGTGGAGKTRLAEAAAREFASLMRDGVWIVRLASLDAAGLIAQQVAQVLNVTEIAGSRIETALMSFLRSRELLLVLDNCEHLVEEAARLASEILAHAPQVKILATSREPLHVRGEHIQQVQPLATAMDEDDETPPPAVLLFAERASAVQAGFVLDENTLPHVLKICERVGGIPLGIELAAARCGVMSVSDMAQRLKDSFKALGRGRRDTMPHHQTLRATLDWSYRLLDADEQALSRRLSVFRGTFDLTSAEFICGDDVVDADDVIDLVERLVDKSLLQSDTSGNTTRLRLLATIREFNATKLAEEGRADALAERHRDYYVGLAERSALAIQVDPARWVGELDAVQDNLRAALRWSLDHDDGPAALRMVGALSYYWVLSGSAAEKRRWYDEALRHLDEADAETRAKALLGAGMAAGLDADYENSDRWLQAAEAGYTELEQPGGVAWSRFWQGRNKTARVWSGTADADQLELAQKNYDDALGWFIPHKDGFGIIITLAFSAWAAQLANRDDAMDRIERAIGAAAQAGIERGEMVSRAHKANLMAGRGEVKQALIDLDSCIDGLQRIGDQLNSRICISLAGLIGLQSGQREYALARARDAVQSDSRLRTREWEPPRIGLAAYVLADRDDLESAARLFALLEHMLPTWRHCIEQCGLRDAEQRYQQAMTTIDAQQREAMASEGQRMTVGDAIIFARRALKKVSHAA